MSKQGTSLIVVKERNRCFEGFLNVDEIVFSIQAADGTLSPEQRHLVMERGDAAGVLLYNTKKNSVILVQQVRIAAFLTEEKTDGELLETVAGVVDSNETPEACAKREAEEETGYRISRSMVPVGTFFSSPGGSTEKIFLYFAEVTDADRVHDGGGIRSEGEKLKVISVPIEKFRKGIVQRRYSDPKILIAGDWLVRQIEGRVSKNNGLRKKAKSGTTTYTLKNSKHLKIGFKAGDISDVRGVHIWVNSENTNMMMDRFFDKTISGRIRTLGADKNETGITFDNIGEALSDKLRMEGVRRYTVEIGEVIETTAGALAGIHGVRKILHVATVTACLERGIVAKLDDLDKCVNNVLLHAHNENKNRLRLTTGPDRSILIPLFGTGDGQLPVEEAVPMILQAALNFIKTTPDSSIHEIYFATYRMQDVDICDKFLSACTDLEREK